MILYFSATGNCKYVAERIAKINDDKVISIVEVLEKGIVSLDIDKEEAVGIISPTYAWGLPSVAVDFLKTVTFSYDEKPYIYFIATYGTTPAHAGYFADQYMKEHIEIGFDAFYSVKMPDTWTPIFDLSDKEKVSEINKNVEPQIDEIIGKISEKSNGDFMQDKVPHITAVVYKPYYEIMRRTNHLTVDDSCIGCGLCANKCPVKAIEMKDGNPVWIKDKCAMCLGCLHRCPKFAIQYGKNTRKHGQYKNPNTRI